MKMITEQEYDEKMERIREVNDSKKRAIDLKTEKNKYKKKILPSTSKFALLVVFLMCFQVIGFTEYIMLKTGDLSSLYVLIGIPATLVPTLLGYYTKAKAENSAGGMTYDLAMQEMIQQNGFVVESDDDGISQ